MKTKKFFGKRALSLLLTLLMVLSLVPLSVFSAFAAEVDTVAVGATAEPYDGVPVTPEIITSSNYQSFGLTDSNWSAYNGYYAIRNAKELYGFANLVNGGDRYINAVLLHDIVVNETVSASGATYEWVSIGASPDTSFMGTFDGNGCTISGLYCNYITATGVGLFGTIGKSAQSNSVNIKNVVLANSYISGSNGLGGIVGIAIGYGSTISNCVVSEDVMVVKSIDNATPYTGGIIGQYDGLASSILQKYNVCCTVSNCVNLGTVQIMTRDFTSNIAANRHNIGSITGVYATEDNAYEFIVVNNCYYLSGHLKDNNGNSLKADGTVVDIGKGGGNNRMSDQGCTILSSATASHTCLSVTHKEIQSTCQYTGLSEYSFCLICGKITSGEKKEFELVVHEYNSATCLSPEKCIYCGTTRGISNPFNHENQSTYYKEHSDSHHMLAHYCCDYGDVEKHSYNSNSVCTLCKHQCTHSHIVNGTCSDCGATGALYLNPVWDSENQVMKFEPTLLKTTVPTKITSSSTTWTSGWYIVEGNVTIDNNITVSGDVNLILANNSHLTTQYSIIVNSGNTLSIYSQSEDPAVAGELTVNGSGGRAGIGSDGTNAGTVNIHGGIISTKSTSRGAGIGSSNTGQRYFGGYININGGTVIATGATGNAGIGSVRTGGAIGAYITINGGNIQANGGVSGELSNTAGDSLELYTITLDGVVDGTTVLSIKGVNYSFCDVKTLDTDKLYLYLPTDSNPTGVYLSNGEFYSGTIDSSTKTGTFTLHAQHNWEDGKCPVCGEECVHNFENDKCTICGMEDPNAKDKLLGHTISLGDKIAVNYYMSLTSKTIADANAKMVFTVPDTGSTYTLEIPVSEVTPNKDGYYVFACEVAAKEMTSVIKAKLVTSADELQLDDYTVQDYAKVFIDNPEKYAKEQKLVKAMLNYGAYSQVYFNYNTEKPANSILAEADRTLSDVDLSEFAYTLEGEDANVSYYGSALSLESETAIKCYFVIDGDAEAVTATVNGKNAELKKNGTLYELKITDISAHQLGNMYEIKVGNLTLSYGAFSYGNTAMSSTKEALKNTVKAMYTYNQEAIEYKG